jgi:hypothetical protein
MKRLQRTVVAFCSLLQGTLMDPTVQTDTLQLQSLPVLVKAFHDPFDMCWNLSPPSQPVARAVPFQVSLDMNRTSTSLEATRIAQRRTQAPIIKILTAQSVHNDPVAGWQLPHTMTRLCQVGTGHCPPHCCVGRSRPARL